MCFNKSNDINKIHDRIRRAKPTRPDPIPCTASRCNHEQLFGGLYHYDRLQLEEYRIESELYEQQQLRDSNDSV